MLLVVVITHVCPSTCYFSPLIEKIYLKQRRQIHLYEDGNNFKSSRGMKGMYQRPSKAIEQGGGFFIPGLEGERIRIASSLFLLSLYGINHISSTSADTSVTISAVVGLFMVFILFLQGSSSSLQPTFILDTEASYLSILQKSGSDAVELIEKSARGMIQTVSGISYVLIASKDEVCLEFGPVSNLPNKILLSDIENSQVNEFIIEPIDSFRLKSKLQIQFPVEIKFVAVFKSKSGLNWIIGSKDKLPLSEKMVWIVDLMSLP